MIETEAIKSVIQTIVKLTPPDSQYTVQQLINNLLLISHSDGYTSGMKRATEIAITSIVK